MTSRAKFLAVATAAVSIPIVAKVDRNVAILMAVGLLVLICVAWKEIDRR